MNIRTAIPALIIAAISALALAACGDTTESPAKTTLAEEAATSPSPEPSESVIDEALEWQEERPPALKQIIDEDVAAQNCEGLQATFDTWADAEDPTNTSAQLLGYLDEGMKEAGCYS